MFQTQDTLNILVIGIGDSEGVVLICLFNLLIEGNKESGRTELGMRYYTLIVLRIIAGFSCSVCTFNPLVFGYFNISAILI
jgi:hypothetical protein